MNRYRSLETIQAVQYLGEPIPGVTCHGSEDEVRANGCDSSRKIHPHVHTQAIGGMTVLKTGDWIFPLPGGPFGVASDTRFRGSWEVPAPEPVLTPVIGAETVELPTVSAEASTSKVVEIPQPAPLVTPGPAAPALFTGNTATPPAPPHASDNDFDVIAFHDVKSMPSEPISHIGEAGE